MRSCLAKFVKLGWEACSTRTAIQGGAQRSGSQAQKGMHSESWCLASQPVHANKAAAETYCAIQQHHKLPCRGPVQHMSELILITNGHNS